MEPHCKKPKHGQLYPVDRLSDLPDFILHRIISFLGFKEACRTCILSRRWTHISNTNPLLLFNRNGIRNGSAAFLEYIDTRMQKYSKENLRIKTFAFDFYCRMDRELACKVDKWLGIAVCNQVENVALKNIIGYYRLTNILLSAKNLRTLDCCGVSIPYYKTMNLASLESLFLYEVVVKERTLNHITTSCVSLKHLGFSNCWGFDNVVIPGCSTLQTFFLTETLPLDGTVTFETSSLEKFAYIGCQETEHWPVISNASFLRNLRKLRISSVNIADDVVSKLLSELALLEILKFYDCRLVKTIRISSSSSRLRDFRLDRCHSLLDVLIDAPKLKYFKYKGQLDRSLSIAINSQSQVDSDISLHTFPYDLETEVFVKLKTLLSELNGSSVLKVSLMNDFRQERECDGVKFNEEEVENVQLGRGRPPCYVKELKLTLSKWMLSESSLSAFLNGLFWICHPDVISLRVDITSGHLTIEPLIRKLEDFERCRRHPLKRVEVGSANCSKLLKSRKLDVILKLFW